ncbi:MAG: glycoside hydrolase family 127 protein [Clostridia bacterium]|nr:glycoside hydrolase family 127 protein [Clostridia bacterium]
MKKWNFYTSKELKPCGWLKRQLEIQAEGLSGNLDKVWRDVRDSAWIGGEAEGWERVPYWLDGFIPLAYLLENEDMIERAKKYINAIIERQKPSGWICPCSDEEIPTYDTWGTQLISKVLVVYYECSGDERIPDVLYRVMNNYYELLKSGTIRLFNWGKYRWFEAFVAINFLKKRYNQGWITDLARILKEQGADYSKMTELWKKPVNKWTYDTHIVNIAMMIKHEAMSCDILGEDYEDVAETLVTVLSEYNGTPVGTFTGDECLSGISPIQGTELCAVVEQMYSYEWLFAHTGDSKWAERLEMLAFNALPATISDDMWTHQYDQLSNQIACQIFPSKPIFRTNGKDAHLFGLEPNFGCCTANFNQGWPKFALSAFLHQEDTVLSAIPVPSSLKTDDISITLNTNYPFENKFEYTVKAKRNMRLKVRVPSFAKKLFVNKKATAFCNELEFDIPADQATYIEIEFDTAPSLMLRPHSLRTVKCGSLVFSLPIEYEKRMLEYERNGVERKYPYCDYEYIPKSEWSYAYSSPFFKLERREMSGVPFASQKPPVTVKAKVKKIAWGLEDGYDTVCAKVPKSITPLEEEKEIVLYPYGCAKLRMTELPLI